MPDGSVDLGYAFGLEPKAAIRYFESKGHRLTWDWQDTWQEANARASTVAKVARLDILNDIRAAVGKTLKTGQTERVGIQELTSVLQAKGWWGKKVVERPDGTAQLAQLGSAGRLKTIFRTNLQTAYMAGRYQQFVANRVARPYWQYVAVLDARTRPEHAAMHGRVFRWDDPIWQWLWPPNDFNCRCRVRALTEAQVKAKGLSIETSEGRLLRDQAPVGVDAVTGEIRTTETVGIRLPPKPTRIAMRDSAPGELPEVKRGQALWWPPDQDPKWAEGEGPAWQVQNRGAVMRPGAGWSYNPAQAAYAPDLDRYPADTARQYVDGVLTGPEFTRWFGIWQRAVAAEVKANPKAGPRDLVKELTRRRPRLTGGMEYPVAVLKDADRTALKAGSHTVLLSSSSLIEHLAAHPEIGLEQYQLVPQMLDEGEVYQQGDERIVLLGVGEQLYRAAIKVDAAKRRVYLLTLFRTTKAQADRQIRQQLTRIR